MKSLFIFVLVTLAGPGVDTPVIVHRLIVQPTSTVNIEGSTNVNRYNCAISRYAGSDTLLLHEGGQNVRPVFLKGEVKLNATSFDCGIALMTSDFHKAIKSKVYPSIVIDFISFEKMPTYSSTPEKFRGILKISLGGVTKLFEMNCAIEADEKETIHLTGSRNFNFSDFELIPPTKMLGAVKVKEALKVSFHLRLTLDPDEYASPSLK
jgi:hypothetical protein